MFLIYLGFAYCETSRIVILVGIDKRFIENMNPLFIINAVLNLFVL